MKTVGSSPCKKNPTAVPFAEPDESSSDFNTVFVRPVSVCLSHVLTPVWTSHLQMCTQSSFSMRAIWPSHHTLLHSMFIMIFCESYKLRSSSLCSFLYLTIPSSVLNPNSLLTTLSSGSYSVCSALNVTHDVSLKPTSKIILFCILILTFLHSR
jgi:hypothetical protein